MSGQPPTDRAGAGTHQDGRPDPTPTASVAADLAGRCAVVTGGTDGIGAATVRLLRSRGADVILIGRSQDKADRLLAEETHRDGAGHTTGSLTAVVTDFALMRNVEEVATRLRAQTEQIDLLVHAVGVLLPRAEHTAEGLEKDFAVSYLSRYLFLERTAAHNLLHPDTRMVNIAASSPNVPKLAQFEFAALADVQARTGMRAHGQAQLACDLLTALAPTRYGITAVGYGPGAVDTNIRREIPGIARTLLRPLYARTTRRPEQAATDILAALTDLSLPAHSASFRNRQGTFPTPRYFTDQQRQHDLLMTSDALISRALTATSG